jgi:hypothetical protein
MSGVIHLTQWALWLLWSGQTNESDICEGDDEVPLASIACTAARVGPGQRVVSTFTGLPVPIPTCPNCAVLWDEAWVAREELLGRAAA